ncbi:helix-turn-helix domain-containing protein [Streptomyces phaeochromogenes]|uniref:helix-turn-helix domain-containing protein n=1 Tax=Streptomyces phaeochromogenes TaxID=1923 RepID=UPI00340DADBB
MFCGSRLRQARAEAEGGALSAEELAGRIGTSKAQILAYETGQRVPDPPRIRQLAHALEVHPLQLADQSAMREWKLADLRRASGLRASDVCSLLGLSSHSYRKLETRGLTAEGCYGVSPRLAAALDVSVPALERHLANAPAVRERLDGIRAALTAVVDTHLAPGRSDLPSSDDPAVKEVAASFGRSATTIVRILSEEVASLREARRRQAMEAATAFYGATAQEQQRARRRMEREQTRFRQLVARLPQRVDAFLRAQLPPQSWETLSWLHRVRNDDAGLGMMHGMPTEEGALGALGALIAPLAAAASPSTACLYEISGEGQRHYANYKRWYDALYPWVDESLRHRERRVIPRDPPEVLWLRRRFARSQTVLFSFDGVLCRLFADTVRSVSGHLAEAATSLHLGTDPSRGADPVALLRSAVDHGSPEQIRHLDGILTTYETAAARRAEPLPGAAQLLGVLGRGPWRLAVVTDHASSAVQTFLTHLPPGNGAPPQLDVFGRPADPRLMKPHPHAVSLATHQLGGDRSRTLLIGESLADALAARAAGVQFIGITAQQDHARRLKEAGAVKVVETLATLLAAVSKIASSPA